MINGFPEETCPLDELELKIANKIAPHIEKKVGKQNAITNSAMIKGINSTYEVKIGAARLRKIINYLRTHNVVKRLIATSKGYYIAETQQELDVYIESLEQRASAIMQVANSLKKQKV